MPINESRWVSREALIKLLGEADAARVVEKLGGTRFYSPAPDAPAFLQFAAKIGDQGIARKFCSEFGGILVTLPRRLVPLDQQIVKLRREMVAPTEIARRLCCAERYVYAVLARQ